MRHEHGGNIYNAESDLDFSANINPFGMPASVIRAACEGIRDAAVYPDPECRELRSAISAAEAVPAEWILCGNGAAELIFLAAGAVRPKRALLIAPGFAEYEQALLTVGCGNTFYSLREERGFALQEDYLDLLTEEIDLAFLCQPNNPTGVLIDEGLLQRILARCAENGTVLVLDECFLGLTCPREEALRERALSERVLSERVLSESTLSEDTLSEGILNEDARKKDAPENRGPGKKEVLEKYPNLLLLRAFTKLYGMAGLRLGYCMCSNEALLERMRERTQPWNVSVPAQRAGIAALRESAFAAQTRQYLGREREFLRGALEKLGYVCFDSAANFLFFRGPEELGERLRQRRILIRDCGNYRGLTRGYWRIAVRTHEENLRLLQALRELKE